MNSRLLDSCTSLVAAIRELVRRSKELQREIVQERAQAKVGEDMVTPNNSSLKTS